MMEKSPQILVFVHDSISPARGTFDIDGKKKAHRRRHVTVKKMHNSKSQTEEEWRTFFIKAGPHFSVDIWRIIRFLIGLSLM